MIFDEKSPREEGLLLKRAKPIIISLSPLCASSLSFEYVFNYNFPLIPLPPPTKITLSR